MRFGFSNLTTRYASPFPAATSGSPTAPIGAVLENVTSAMGQLSVPSVNIGGIGVGVIVGVDVGVNVGVGVIVGVDVGVDVGVVVGPNSCPDPQPKLMTKTRITR
jgi:hypothetical protein